MFGKKKRKHTDREVIDTAIYGYQVVIEEIGMLAAHPAFQNSEEVQARLGRYRELIQSRIGEISEDSQNLSELADEIVAIGEDLNEMGYADKVFGDESAWGAAYAWSALHGH